jgi:hypothetical protein
VIVLEAVGKVGPSEEWKSVEMDIQTDCLPVEGMNVADKESSEVEYYIAAVGLAAEELNTAGKTVDSPEQEEGNRLGFEMVNVSHSWVR